MTDKFNEEESIASEYIRRSIFNLKYHLGEGIRQCYDAMVAAQALDQPEAFNSIGTALGMLKQLLDHYESETIDTAVDAACKSDKN